MIPTLFWKTSGSGSPSRVHGYHHSSPRALYVRFCLGICCRLHLPQSARPYFLPVGGWVSFRPDVFAVYKAIATMDCTSGFEICYVLQEIIMSAIVH